jgi:hypothetical protein
MTRYRIICVALFVLLGMSSLGAQSRAAEGDAKSRDEIRHLMDVYMQAVDEADPKLAATVFLNSKETSFINPVGHERGWNQIADEMFVKLMGQTFSKRHLTASAEPVIHVYGDAAVAEFDWDFVATLRSNGSTVHTTGRESQFYVRFPDKGWKLVHVHYSGPAVPPPSNGQF